MRYSVLRARVLPWFLGLLGVLILAAASSQAAQPPQMQLIAPAGGEVFRPGEKHRVIISLLRTVRTVTLLLSTDGGQTFPIVLANAIDNTGPNKKPIQIADFVIPNVSSTICVAKAVGTTVKGPVTDQSSFFVIGTPTLDPGVVLVTQLADGSVTNPKLAEHAVSDNKVTSDVGGPGGSPATTNYVMAADGTGNAIWKDPNTLGIVAPPGGAAGGDLTGTFPNPLIAKGAVTSPKIADGAVLENHINASVLSSNGGLSGGSGAKLLVNVDRKLSIVNNSIGVTNNGIDGQQLAQNITSVTAAQSWTFPDSFISPSFTLNYQNATLAGGQALFVVQKSVAPSIPVLTLTADGTLSLLGGINAANAPSALGNLSVTGLASSGPINANNGLFVTGANLDVGNGRFTVAPASGNVATVGTLNVGGATTLGALSAGNTSVGKLAASGDLNVNNGNFIVAALTGNTTVAGQLNVAGATTLANTLNAGATTLSSLNVTGATTLNSLDNTPIGQITPAPGSFTTLNATGAVVFSGGSLQIGAGATGGSLTLHGANGSDIVLNPGTPNGLVSFTLPPNTGTLGQVLRTDGAGILTWASSNVPSTAQNNSTLRFDAAVLPGQWKENATLQADGSGGMILVPVAANTGSLKITATSNAPGSQTIITNDPQAAGHTYFIPDVLVDARFVMDHGAQTILGAKTFSDPLTANGGLTVNGAALTANNGAGFGGDLNLNGHNILNVGTVQGANNSNVTLNALGSGNAIVNSASGQVQLQAGSATEVSITQAATTVNNALNAALGLNVTNAPLNMGGQVIGNVGATITGAGALNIVTTGSNNNLTLSSGWDIELAPAALHNVLVNSGANIVGLGAMTVSTQAGWPLTLSSASGTLQIPSAVNALATTVTNLTDTGNLSAAGNVVLGNPAATFQLQSANLNMSTGGVVTLGGAFGPAGQVQFHDSTNANTGTLQTANNLTANQNYTLPDKSGTVLLSSDIPPSTVVNSTLRGTGTGPWVENTNFTVTPLGAGDFKSSLTVEGGLNVSGGAVNLAATTTNITAAGPLNISTGNGGILSLTSASGQIVANSALVPNTDDALDLGTSITRWRNLFLGNNATIGGTLNVTGATTLAGLNAGAATLASLGVTNNATVGGTLGVTGATTLSTLSTSGLATLNSLNVTGATTLAGLTAGATTLGATTINGTLAMGANNITGSGAINWSGNITVTNPGVFTGNGSGLNTLNGSNISSGLVPVAFGGTGVSSPAAGSLLVGNGAAAMTVLPISATVGNVLKVTGATTLGWGTLDLSQASNVGASILGVANGGTGANLSATGGAGQYVKQAGAGAAFTVGTIPAGDVPSLASLYVTLDATAQAIAGAKTFNGGITMGSALAMGGNNITGVGTNITGTAAGGLTIGSAAASNIVLNPTGVANATVALSTTGGPNTLHMALGTSGVTGYLGSLDLGTPGAGAVSVQAASNAGSVYTIPAVATGAQFVMNQGAQTLNGAMTFSSGATFQNGINVSGGTITGSGALLTNIPAATAITGVLPIANGGTGISTAPSAGGQFLRSTGANTWGVGAIEVGDLPALNAAGQYVQFATGASQADGSNNVSIFINKGLAATGNLIELQKNGVDLFVVGNTGNTTITGTLGVAGATTLTALTAGAATLGITTATSINNTPIGNTTASTGAFTTLTGGATTLGATTATSINSTQIGNTAPSTGAFTTLTASGALNANGGITTTAGPLTLNSFSGAITTTASFTAASLATAGALTVGGSASITGGLTLGKASPSGAPGSITLFDGSTTNTAVLNAPNVGANQTYNLPNKAGGTYTLATTSDLAGLVQLAPSTAQVDASTNSSIFINKTGASGNLFELQKNNVDAFVVGNTGNTTIGGTLTTNGGAVIRSGSGSPNTVVTGNPGDLYLNTAGGANTTLYVKESGAGTNTGWVAK